MSGPDGNPEQFKATQRRVWDGVASGWQAWWDVTRQAGQELSNRLIELAHVEPGMRVLDVATGTGEPALTAAQIVGPSGSVLALDASDGMLAVARDRAAAQGLANVEFRQGDAEHAALPDGEFDAILSRWGIFFFLDLVPSLAALRRTLTQRGRFAAAVWGPPDQVPLINLSAETLVKHLGVEPPPEMMGPYRLSDPLTLQRAFAAAGYSDIYTEAVTVAFDFASADDYLAHQQSSSPMLHMLIQRFGPERQAELWEAIKRAVTPYTTQEGRVRLPNVSICVSASR